MRVYEFINEYAKSICAPKVFGVPGSYIMPVWDNLKNFEVILCTNEADAGYIAGGYCREVKQPVIVLTTGSPGVTNSISGMAAAYKDFLPVIFISGVNDSCDAGSGVFQEEGTVGRNFSSRNLCESVCKGNYYISSVNEAVDTIVKAIDTANSGCKGCVHISIPTSVQKAEIPDGFVENVFSKKAQKSIDDNNEEVIPSKLMQLLEEKENVLFIIGAGVEYAGVSKQLMECLEQTSYPFLCTMKGMYCVNMENNNFIGTLGMGFSPMFLDFIEEYDPKAVVILGSSISRIDFSDALWNSLQGKDIFVFYKGDVFSYPKNVSTTLVYVTSYTRLVKEFSRLFGETKGNINKLITKYRSIIMQDTRKKINGTSVEKHRMARTIDMLNDIVKKGVLVSADAGNHYIDAVKLYQTSDVNGFWIDVGLAAMGNGLCGTIGMAFAGMHRRYISVTGDGCVLMNGNSIHLASVYHLPVLFLVYNNHSLGRVRVGQATIQKYVGSDIDNVDFAAYGNSLGVESYHVETEQQFKEYVEHFIAQGEPMLLEVMIDKDERPVGFE